MATPIPIFRPPIDPLEFVGSFPGEPPYQDLPEIAFVGRSNVGKSSCLNMMLGRKAAARVSRTPGRTQLINLFKVRDRLVLVDLPGYGYAKVPGAIQATWGDMIEGYLERRTALRLLVVLVDGRLPAQELDRGLIEARNINHLPKQVVVTKIDRLSKSERKPALIKLAAGLGLPFEALLPFSSETGEGVTDLWKRIEAAIKAAPIVAAP